MLGGAWRWWVGGRRLVVGGGLVGDRWLVVGGGLEGAEWWVVVVGRG